MSEISYRPVFVEWHNPPNRPTLIHICLELHPQTLCGSQPRGKIRHRIIAPKKSLCSQCVNNFDMAAYHGSGGRLVNFIQDLIDSQYTFGISLDSLPSLSESGKETESGV